MFQTYKTNENVGHKKKTNSHKTNATKQNKTKPSNNTKPKIGVGDGWNAWFYIKQNQTNKITKQNHKIK